MLSLFFLTLLPVLTVATGVVIYAQSIGWGLPRWPKPQPQPCVCATCGRGFPYLNPEALPEGMEALGADGLLQLHVRAQHQQLPGYWYGRLPVRKVTAPARRPPEFWHGKRTELLTEEQWRGRMGRLRRVK